MHDLASKNIITQLLQAANITLNGHNTWDIQVRHEGFYARVLREGSLGLGESYMDGWWDCSNLDEFFARVIQADLEQYIHHHFWLWPKLFFLKWLNPQSPSRALEVGQKHYDLGNDLFKSMLDSRMNYTCGYWQYAQNLEQAQLDKLELTCQKLMLKPGMRVLDVGCGFGAFAHYAASHYGVTVVGITISEQQRAYAQNYCANLPVEIRFQDYREVEGQFDRVVSLGMFEHVGYLNYHTYMEKIHQCLTDDGLFLLHTIGNNSSTVATDPWINKYIFPNGMLPSMVQISQAAEKLFIMENWANFGAYYDNTLMAWAANIETHWSQLKDHYDERFHRMWRYYLLACAGAFRVRSMQLWQIVFSKRGVKGVYPIPHLKPNLRGI